VIQSAPLVRGRELKDKEGRIFKLEGPANADELKTVGLFPPAIEKLNSAASRDNFYTVISNERRESQNRQHMQQLRWRDLPFIGVELKSIQDMYEEPFEFPDLEKQFAAGGKLHGLDHQVYFFLSAQPMLLADTVHNVPYLVAIDCKYPPPSLLASHSIQAAREEIIPMKQAKIDWVPYIPKEMRSAELEKLKVQLFVLGWLERDTQKKRMNEDKMHAYEYYHPYIVLPQLAEKESVREVTQVTFDYEHDGKKYPVVFDKEVDRTQTFIPSFLVENKIIPPNPKGEDADEDGADSEEDKAAENKVIDAAEEERKKKKKEESDKLLAAIKKAFADKRAHEQAVFDTKKKEIADLSPQHIDALRAIRLYKFYPSHPAIDTRPFASELINPYYGHAHDVFAPPFVPGPYEKPKKKEEPKEEEAVVVSPPKGKRARTSSMRSTKDDSKPADTADVPMESPSKEDDVSASKKTPSRAAGRSRSARGTPTAATPGTRTPSSRAAKSASKRIAEESPSKDDESSSTPRKRKSTRSKK